MNRLTCWSRDPLEKLIFTNLFKKFPTFNETKQHILMFRKSTTFPFCEPHKSLSLPYPHHWFEPGSSQIHSRIAVPLPSATVFCVFVSLWLAVLAWILVASSCHCGSTAHTHLSGWTCRSLWTRLLPPLEWTSSLCGPASVRGAPVHPCTVTVTVLFSLLVTNWGLCSSEMLC